jgi:hypothetical protein
MVHFAKLKMKVLFQTLFALSPQHSVDWQQAMAVGPLCVSYTSLSVPHLFPLEEKYSGTSISWS